MKRVRDILPLLVILAGLLVLLYPTISNFLIEQNASRAIASYDAATVDLGQEEREQMLADARAYNDALAASSGAGTPASEGGEPAQVGGGAGPACPGPRPPTAGPWPLPGAPVRRPPRAASPLRWGRPSSTRIFST